LRKRLGFAAGTALSGLVGKLQLPGFLRGGDATPSRTPSFTLPLHASLGCVSTPSRASESTMDTRILRQACQSDSQRIVVSPASQKVLCYIERTFNDILNEISVRPRSKPVITLQRISTIKPYYDDTDSMPVKWHIEDREVSYSFPGKNKDEAWRFGRGKTKVVLDALTSPFSVCRKNSE